MMYNKDQRRQSRSISNSFSVFENLPNLSFESIYLYLKSFPLGWISRKIGILTSWYLNGIKVSQGRFQLYRRIYNTLVIITISPKGVFGTWE